MKTTCKNKRGMGALEHPNLITVAPRLSETSEDSDFSNKRSAMLIRFSGFGAPPARLFLQGVSTCLLCILHDTLIRFCDFPPPHATLTFDTLI